MPRVPVFTSLRGYQSNWLRGDLLAGLTVWAVLVPESLAYAAIAGVSPVVGLYAAPGALLLYAAAVAVDGAPEYHRTVAEAVAAATAAGTTDREA